MTPFKTTLFKLLDAADVTVIDGYEIEEISSITDTKGRDALYCECDEDNNWVFHDQEVTVREGECGARVDGKHYLITCYSLRPIEERDLGA